MSRNEKISASIFFISMSFLFYFAFRSEEKTNSIIDKNKFVTIAKIYELKSARSFTYAKYYYYFKNEKYFSGEYVNNDKMIGLNKYFKVEISSIKPNYSRIIMDYEIENLKEIKNAGFE